MQTKLAKNNFFLNTTDTFHVLIILSFAGSGFFSLIYEICWIRKSALIFGSTTFALSTVIAVFFGGMAIGNFIFASIAFRTKKPLSPEKVPDTFS